MSARIQKWILHNARIALAALTLFVIFPSSVFGAGVLTVGVQLEPPNLDPTSGAAAAIDEIVYANIFEGLTRIDENGNVLPGLAESWRISDDGLTYEFTLRNNVRFHDGSAFDAQDVIFTYERAGAPQSSNAQRSIFEKILQIEALSPTKVRITLAEPMGEFLTYLGWGDAVIVAPESAETNSILPIGTGPFQFHRWRKGASVTLRRFEGYWGAAAPLDELNFLFISDPTAAYAALLAGDVDGFPNYPAPENLPLLKRDNRFKVVYGTGEGEMLIAMNNGKAPFNNILVRQALNHAIDKEAVISAGLFGIGTPIGSHFPPHHAAYIDLTNTYPYDPIRAKELLKEAGLQNGFSLELTLPPPAYARRSGEVVAAQLEAVGINVKIKNIEWAQWLDQVFANMSYDLTIVSHTEPLDIDIYARDDYYFQYRNDRFKPVMSTLQSETDQARRISLYKQAQSIIAEDAVNVFIASSPKIAVWRNDVSGVWANAPLQANDFTQTRVGDRLTASAQKSVIVTSKAGYMLLVLLLALFAIIIFYSRVDARYILTRLASMIASLFAATIIIFVVIEIAPGDPARFMMGLNADAQSVAVLRAELGLDKAIHQRYLDWTAGMLKGDFGTSYTYRVPVRQLIAERLWVSAPLAVLAFLLSTTIGLFAGVTAAARKNKTFGRFIITAAQVGVSLPNFWLAILFVLIFAVQLNWFSAGGFPGWENGIFPALKALLLPAIALAIPQAAILTQIMRSSMLNTLNNDYIRTARAKGLSLDQTFRRHALRNALIPVLTILGLQFAFLVAGSIIVETVFYLPGLGRLVLQSIIQRDLIVVKSIVAILVFIVIAAAFFVDLTYAIVDPRLRKARNA